MGKKKKPFMTDELKEYFEKFDSIDFPEMKSDPPPEKSLKERILEQHRARVEAIKAHEKRFSESSYMPDAIFMRRGDRNFGSFESTQSSKSNVFKEDLDTMDTITELDPFPAIRFLSRSNFEAIHAPRERYLWSRSTRDLFKERNREMNESMHSRGIPRLPNAEKRLRKIESAQLRLSKLDAQEVMKRVDEEKVDIFGHLALLPYTFTKSEKPSIERKRDVLKRCHDLFYDYQYQERVGSRETDEYHFLEARKRELERFIANPTSENMPCDFPSISMTEPKENKVARISMESPILREASNLHSSVPVSKPKTKEAPKRKIADETPEIEVLLPPKKIEKLQRLSSEIVKEKGERSTKVKNVDPKEVELKKDLERRRLLCEQRDKEAQDKRKADEEKHKRKQLEEKEEYARIKEQQDKEREEAKRAEEERYAAYQEQKKRQEQEDEDRIKRKQKERERLEKQSEMEELERLRQNIGQAVKNQPLALPAPQTVLPSPPPITNRWNLMRCLLPKDWSQRKDKFVTKFKWPTEDAHLILERSAAVSKAISSSSSKAIIIPQENNVSTIVHCLTMPPKKVRVAAPQFKAPKPVRKDLIPADDKATEKLVNEIKLLMRPTRRNFPVMINLYNQEVDYKTINMARLKLSIHYPFKASDGMYWPVFYALREKSNSAHVVALTTCNSFSGKLASFDLLTATQEDENRCKKFEKAYQESSGDWAEYSQKPGRFSNRIGYKPHFNKSGEDFDAQKHKARKILINQQEKERENDALFRGDYQDYRNGRNRNRFQQKLTLHLRELVADARIDTYSLRESFQGIDRLDDHPGTRDSQIEMWWYTQGYQIFLDTRDLEYGLFMSKVSEPYERMLPHRFEAFNEWCFAPMLASMYYQARYKSMNVFPDEDMKSLARRRATYNALLKEKKFHMKEFIKVCRLNKCDKRQWTILHDQLVSHFKDFPAIFQLMYDKRLKMVPRVDNAVYQLMKTTFKDRENNWDLCRIPLERFRN